MITRWDDYFVHQTSDPIAKTTPDRPNFMDRMYFNSHDRDGRFMLGVGLGQYRNVARMDAIAYLCTPGQQHTICLARTTSDDDYAELRVGPSRLHSRIRWEAGGMPCSWRELLWHRPGTGLRGAPAPGGVRAV